MKYTIILLAFLATTSLLAQQERWQQHANYAMEIDFDVEKHQFAGKQTLKYTNNSPDKLHKVFYHLYFNAFKPGSMMDVRSRSISDPDSRVGDRISKLTPEQQGYLHTTSLTLDGKDVAFEEVGTILEVTLKKPIEAGQTVTFEMEFNGQVPLQIRRSGRQNSEGIAYSMSQWYPKMSEYDYEGWHANPYVGREFHGVWGEFDVKINIDHRYVLGGTGLVVNGEDVGYGYGKDANQGAVNTSGKTQWHFKADKVHDFVWAADPDYVHKQVKMKGGAVLHLLYQENPEYIASWESLIETAPKAFEYLSEHYGAYPYPQYSVIQGGDGGMEYPMATLVTGDRSESSLLGVTVHEAAHSWFQGVLATNEALYEWMDEGFTTYSSNAAMAHVNDKDPRDSHTRSYGGYNYIVNEGLENPLSTHADHYETNVAYGVAAYSKGEVLLSQLRYVIGEENLAEGMLKYYDQWKFKHPNPTDFKRVMECQSGLELDWYFEYFEKSTRTIDYAIDQISQSGDSTSIVLERKGLMPMPIDLLVTYQDGSSQMLYIPMVIMRGEKPAGESNDRVVLEDWAWVNPTYTASFDSKGKKIARVEIDPSKWMADIKLSNNVVNFEDGVLYTNPD